MFSGIGGFELGFPKEWECVGYSEIDKYAIQIYRKHFPKHRNYGDATKIDTKQLPDFDLLVAGFPCQAFSVAGKRQGFNDTRGTLFFEIARVLRDKKPRYFLLENVKGLLSNKFGKTFQTILRVLTDLGYELEWQVLNSKNFGVPQNRERVFIVGYFGKEGRPKVFPIGESNQPTFKGYFKTLNSSDWRGSNRNQGQNLIEITKGKSSQGQRVYSVAGISKTLASNAGGQGGKTGLYAIPVFTPDRIKKMQNGRRFKTNREPAFTLTGQDIYGVYNGLKIRRLTPIECERLQAFPDNWTAKGIDDKGNEVKISDTQRYKTLGNAVTVSVVKFIAEKLKRLY